MNSTQRKFLIDKVTGRSKIMIQILQDSREELPEASNYVFKAIMDGTLEIQPSENILATLKRKALEARAGDNWLNKTRGYNHESGVRLALKELMIEPKGYREECDRVKEKNRDLDNQIGELLRQVETLEVRIQLASNSTLQKMINEVDDMGDLSLIDTKIKLLNN